MKRIALMLERLEEGDHRLTDDLPIREVLERSTELIRQEQSELDRIWFEELVPSLNTQGVVVLDYGELPPTDRLRVDQWFEREVEPVLTPLAVDEGHPFPFISNLSTSLGVLLRVPGESVKQFARINPDGLPHGAVPHNGPVGVTQDPNRFDLSHSGNWSKPIWAVFLNGNSGQPLFRLTRGAGLETGEEDDDEPDLMSTVETELARRRFAGPVRLEMEPESSLELRSLLLDELGLPEVRSWCEQVRSNRPPTTNWQICPVLICNAKNGRPLPRRLRESSDMFSTIRDGDLSCITPTKASTTPSNGSSDAAHDDKVVAIKQTLYRTTSDSFIESLIHAAEAGNKLPAWSNFGPDLMNATMGLARVLENGVHVAYGVVGLKTHCKLSPGHSTRRRRSSPVCPRRHGQLHPGTAQLYTDCGILSCDPRLTEDVADVFNFLTGRSRKKTFNDILLAPQTMKATFLRLINEEAEHAANGKPARIWGKMNQLEDPEIIQASARFSSWVQYS